MPDRRISAEDVEAIAVGAGILGTGGGGNVYVAKLWIRRLHLQNDDDMTRAFASPRLSSELAGIAKPMEAAETAEAGSSESDQFDQTGSSRLSSAP